MSVIALVTILILIFTVTFVIWIVIFFQSRRQLAIWGQKGTMIFKLDPITRNVSPYKLDQLYDFRAPKKFWFKKNRYKTHGSNILKLFGLITNNPQGDKVFREILHQIGNGKENINVDFVAKDMRVGQENLRINFNFIVRKIIDVSDYLMIIKWKVLIDYPKNENDNWLTSIYEVAQNKSTFKGFITFDLNNRIPFVQEKFLKEIFSFINLKKYEVFLWSNLLVVICYAQTYKKIKKKTTRFIKFIDTKKRKIGLSQFIRASGSARFKDISSKKDLYKALATLDFITNLSLRWNEPFIDIRTAQSFKQEFIAYNNSSKQFRELVRLHNFDHKFLPIKSRKSQRKIIDYYVPDLKKFDQYEIRNILLNEHNQKYLIDSNIEKFLNEKKLEDSILIDINSSWLVNNFSRLVVGKICYIIKFDDYSHIEKASMIINDLITKGFSIGMRVDSFSHFFVTFIQKIKVAIIIIDQKIIEEKPLINTIHYTRLLALKNIFESTNIKVIFENLSPQITNQLATNLGINFYFNY